MVSIRLSKDIATPSWIGRLQGTLPVTEEPWRRRAVREGNDVIGKFGLNPNIGATPEEDVWDIGGDYPFPASAQSLELVCADANDTAAGTGCQAVRVYTLDDTWTAGTQDVVTNGGTVALTGTHMRVYRAYALDAGSGEENAGNINIQVAGGGTVLAQIRAGFGQTEMAVYTVPLGKSAYVYRYDVSLAGKTSANVSGYLRTREEGMCWRVRRTVFAGNPPFEFMWPLILPAKTDIVLRASSDTVNTEVAGGFDLELVNA